MKASHLTDKLVGGKIFKEIKSDERVIEDLAYCLYCYVYTSDEKLTGETQVTRSLDYKIPLDSHSEWMKQCPACKTMYLLKDPTNESF